MKANALPAILIGFLVWGPALEAQQASKTASGQETRDAEKELASQVFLDRANFAPGAIDGRDGEFTRKAAALYGQAQGTSKEAAPGAAAASLPLQDAAASPTTEYTVTAEDAGRIGTAPTKPKEQAEQKWLPYTSVLELLAEKFHATQAFLRKLNPQLEGRDARAGDKLTVPNVEPFDIAAVEAKQTKEEAPPASEKTGGPWLDIDVGQKELHVKEGDRLLATFPITPGSAELPAPKGDWHIQSINFMPRFRYDQAMLKHGYRSKDGILTPPGPNNKVGVLWMSLNKKGIGIHGTDEPETIGRASSHGCIRLSNWDAIRLAGMIEPGTKVVIR